MTRRPSLVPQRIRPSGPRVARRGGFSLIELMIVITIIAILAGILLAGVMGGISRARVAQVTAEMKNFEQACKQFEAELGIQPPSFIVLHEFSGAGTGWNSPNVNTRTSRALIKQMFKEYSFTTPVDINGDGDTTDSFTLNGAECLVFFLGGRKKLDASTTPPTVTATGFSKVPTSPFGATTGSAWGPYFEFNSRQFVDIDGDGFYEYLDAIPGQTKPIQYFSSYGGQGYRPYGLDGDLSTTADNEIFGSLQWIYTRSNGTSATSPGEPYNANTFQLISAGFDGEYGVGGFVDSENGVKDGTLYLPAGHSPATVVRNNDPITNTQYERDNITNFLQGEIH